MPDIRTNNTNVVARYCQIETMIVDLILLYTNVCIALYTRCFASVCGKSFTGDSNEIRTHNLLLTSADVFTCRAPCLPDDDWPARILYSSGFCDIYRLMKFLRRVTNNWVNFALHQCVYSTVYSVLSECLGKKLYKRLGPPTSCLLVQTSLCNI